MASSGPRHWYLVLIGLVIALATAVALPGAARAAGFGCVAGDDFDRPASSDLGSMWNEVSGTGMSIDALGQVGNVDPSFGLMTFLPAQADSACASVIADGTVTTQYVALVLNYATVDENVFVKVQNQNGGTNFDTVYFYEGNNGSPFASTMPLATPFAAANLQLLPSGDTVELQIDNDLDGLTDETVTGDAPAPASNATTAGLGIYGPAVADFWGVHPVPPNTTITKQPKKKIVTGRKSKKLRFEFESPAPVHTFTCSFDGSPSAPCESPFVVKKAKAGKHVFSVAAVDGLGTPDDSPAKAKVKIKRK